MTRSELASLIQNGDCGVVHYKTILQRFRDFLDRRTLEEYIAGFRDFEDGDFLVLVIQKRGGENLVRVL